MKSKKMLTHKVILKSADPEVVERFEELLKAAEELKATSCGNCGCHIDSRDGNEIGGMPGITYQWCNSCGWSRAITSRPKKERLR